MNIKNFIVGTLFIGILTLVLTFSRADTIGPPADGTRYQVTSSTEITKSAASQCGFNDTGAANNGIFRREGRLYREYKDGKVVKEWSKSVDVFVRCYTP